MCLRPEFVAADAAKLRFFAETDGGKPAYPATQWHLHGRIWPAGGIQKPLRGRETVKKVIKSVIRLSAECRNRRIFAHVEISTSTKTIKIIIMYSIIRNTLILAAAVLLGTTAQAAGNTDKDTPSKVYFVRDITADNLIRIYEALGREANGRVAVKISTGEPGGHNFLDPQLIAPLVKRVKGTIVECNTAYGGRRSTTEEHYKAAAEHGFTAIADVDIMDGEGETELPVRNGRHLKADLVGRNFLNYDFTIVLSHFKGHAMGGFGGAIKNISIGIGSAGGKARIHTAGRTDNPAELWQMLPEQDDFLESMAEAAKAVADHCGRNIIYISVANKLSVDCDCSSNPHAPQMADIGILASLDPVALDRACTDLVRQSPDEGKVHLIERIDSRHGMHTLDYGESIGLGSQKYTLVEL